jgi:PEP-CTERM motif
MLNRVALAVAVLVLISTPRIAVASPITYDFTGTLNQPVDGATTFNGSLTFNATPTGSEVPIAGYSVSETGSDVSLTVNVGGQVMNFSNSPQNPHISLMVSADVEPNQPLTTTEFSVYGGNDGGATGSGTTGTFFLSFYDVGLGAVPSNLANLPLPVQGEDTELTVGSSSSVGTLTSIEVASAPEPSTLAVFAGLGLAALVRRRCGRLRGRGRRTDAK